MNSESTQRNAAKTLVQELLKEADPGLSGAVSRALTRLEDHDLRQGILDAFQEELESADIDQLWATWHETRHPELEGFLVDIGVNASKPITLHVVSRLKLGQVQELTQSGVEEVPALLIAGEDQDARVAENALWVLGRLQNPLAQEEVCRWVIDHDHTVAKHVALAANFTPKDPHQRALFFLLTEQWERYENLDFDASLFGAVFQAADPGLRSIISSFALRSGWSGYVDAITKSRQTRKLSDLNEDEWEAILAILSRDRRGKEMWRLAQVAPVGRSAQILRELIDLGWQPEDGIESSEFSIWVQAARQCWQLGKPVSRLPGEITTWNAQAKPITCLCMRPQGDLLASGSTDHTVCLWHCADGSLQQRLQGHTAYIQSLSASPDGVYLASGGADRSVRIWHFENGALLHTLGGHAEEVASLVFSPDSRLLASGDANQVRVWDVHTGNLIKQFPISEGPVSQLAFDAESAFLLASGQTNLVILAVSEEVPPVSIPERVRSWQMLAARQSKGDRTHLITSSSYKKIRLWEIPSGRQISVLDGLADGKNLCANLDGNWIIASERNILRKWEYPGGSPKVDLDGHTGRITALLCDPQGKFLLSAGEEGSIHLWHLYQNRRHNLTHGLSTPVSRMEMDLAGQKIVYSEHNRITIHNLFDLDQVFQQPLETIHAEILAQAEDLTASFPESQVERAWLHLTRLAVNWRNRYDIEISETLPTITIGSYDIELNE